MKLPEYQVSHIKNLDPQYLVKRDQNTVCFFGIEVTEKGLGKKCPVFWFLDTNIIQIPTVFLFWGTLSMYICTGKIWLLDDRVIKYIRYRALTRLRYQSFDNSLEDEPRVVTPICQSLQDFLVSAILIVCFLNISQYSGDLNTKLVR